jgi:hypothetical protein
LNDRKPRRHFHRNRDTTGEDCGILLRMTLIKTDRRRILTGGAAVTDKTARILLEHQSGSNPEQIYLRVFVQNSKWHAMARINIRRL